MVQSIKVDDFLKKAEKEKNGKTTIFQVIAGDHFIRYDPVSYTHLDVYKRQDKSYNECMKRIKNLILFF